MNFVVTNAPLHFMLLVQDILHGSLDVYVVVFIDGILVYSRNIEEHPGHMEADIQEAEEASIV